MSRRILAQSVLLPRLLAAIGAGSLLAAPGCGAKSKDASAGEASNGVDGQETSKGQETDTGSKTTDATRTTGNTTNYISEVETTTEPSAMTTGKPVTTDTTPPPGPTGPSDTNSAPSSTAASTPTSIDGGATTLETTSANPVGPDAGTIDSGPITEPASYECEFGEPQQFCIGAVQMEDQARWGVGDLRPVEPLRSDDEIAAGWDENGCMNHEWIASGCCNPALAKGEPQDDGTCCFIACEGVCCGRPFIVNGVAVVADVAERSDWLAQAPQVALDSLSACERQSLVDAWLADAQMEHASIASFNQFSLDLLQLGAPPELVRDCQLAGLDEIEHARMGFAIATRLSGTTYGPGNLRLGSVQTRSLAEALSAAIVEGCVGETLAAAVVAEQARCCTDAELASHLSTVVEDELRHSELAWRFVAWALQRYGAPARVLAGRAFEQALSRLPNPPSEAGLSASVLHAAGRVTSEEWQCAVRDVMRGVIEPATRVLLGEGSIAATPPSASCVRTAV
jgi:hypothetical protein